MNRDEKKSENVKILAKNYPISNDGEYDVQHFVLSLSLFISFHLQCQFFFRELGVLVINSVHLIEMIKEIFQKRFFE